MFDTLTDSFKNAIGKIRFHDDDKALKKATTELKKSISLKHFRKNLQIFLLLKGHLKGLLLLLNHLQ